MKTVFLFIILDVLILFCFNFEKQMNESYTHHLPTDRWKAVA